MTRFIAHPDFLALDNAIRAAITRALRVCTSKSREAVAEELSEATGVQITLRMLNDYTAESRRPYRFPAAWVIPFCRITGDDSLQRLLLGPELADILRLGELELTAYRVKAEIISGLSRGLSEQTYIDNGKDYFKAATKGLPGSERSGC